MKITQHSHLIFSICVILFSTDVFAQTGVSINSTGAAPNANAILDISSNTKGALLPRMTSVERLAFVPTGLSGMTVYDTTTQSYWYWDGAANQWRQIPNTSTVVHNTLDGAYDQGGAGAGRVINTDAGAVDIQGTGGLLVNGSVGIGASGTDKLHVQTTGGNTSVRVGYSPSYVDNLVYFGEGTDVYVGEKGIDDRLYLYGRSLSVDINGDLGTAGSVLKSNGSTVSWQPDLGLTGTGTLNYLARWTSASTLGIGATFDNGTNVGIGNTSPGHKLSVGDATADAQAVSIRGYSNSPASWKGGGAFGFSNAAVIMGQLSGVAQLGGHSGTLNAWADLAINSGGGNVGIGTSTPYAKLNVGDPNGPSVYLTREDASTLANDVLGSLLFDSTDDNSPSTTDASAGIRGHASQDHGNSNKGGYMTFFTKNNVGNAGAASERMRIAADGNIGIGTSAPASILHVSTSQAGNVSKLHNPTLANGSLVGHEFGKANSVNNMAEFRYNHITDGNAGNFINLGLWGNANTLTVVGTGNVGIGTIGPAQKLHVQGNTRITGLGGSGNRMIQTDNNGDLSVSAFDPSSVHTGSGTVNYLARWTGSTSLGNGVTQDNGTDVGIGIAPGGFKLNVNGTTQASAYYVNHGSGNVLEVGDDSWIGDINVANTTGIYGQQNGTHGGLRLGSNGGAYFYSDGSDGIGLGTTAPASKLHVMGKINIHQSGAGGGQNRFEGLETVASANGRAQLVLSSSYSDLTIASSQVNDNHGSTLTFATYNPANAADYRKFVVNQGNWGARRGFLDFGFSDAGGRANPHANINGSDNVLSMDGYNKRVGIGTMGPSSKLEILHNTVLDNGIYNSSNIEVATNNASNPSIGFHREGYSATALYHSGYGNNSLRIRNADGLDAALLHEGNVGSYGIQNQNSFVQGANFIINGSGRADGDFRAPIFYDQNNTGFYLDPNNVSILNDIRPSILYDRDDTGYYLDPNGSTRLRNMNTLAGFDGNYPANSAIRMTPNFHFNTPAGYAMIVNWDNGAVGGGTQQFRVGNGTGTDQFYVRADGLFYGRRFVDLDDGNYYSDPNSISYFNDIRPNIIYDRNNTGYYWDGDATSNMLHTRTNGELYYNNWMRHMTGSQSGLYWQEGVGQYWHIYPNNQQDMIMRTGASNGGIMGTIGDATPRGYVHWTTSNEIGLLNSGRGWQLRSYGGGGELYDIWHANDFRPYIIYDRNNTGYYWNGDGTSRMYYGDFNYLHTQVNDSWFPYTGNNYNYFRGQTYAWNTHWYDENNTGYYMNADNTTRLAYLYQGIGAYNVGGWTSGRIQTESTSDGHQYHPVTGNYGYIGTSGQYWWYSYAGSHVSVSQRQLKRDIKPLDEPLYDYVMNDIDKIKPSFYKFKVETDEYEEGNEPKYRANMRIGLILDEAPDYLQDQAFSGIDIYALATLGIAGVKHNREEIQDIKKSSAFTKINDFGSEVLNTGSVWISFDEEFSSKLSGSDLPSVSLTPNKFGIELIVTEKTNSGFRVAQQGNESVSFDWMAMAKVAVDQEDSNSPKIDTQLASQLKVDEAKKSRIRAYWDEQKNIGQTEHARQTAEHERITEEGKAGQYATQDADRSKHEAPDGNYLPASKVDPPTAPSEDPSPMHYTPKERDPLKQN